MSYLFSLISFIQFQMKFFSFFPTCLWVLLPLACLLLGPTQRADLHDQVAPTQIQITNCFSRAKRQSVIRHLPFILWEGNFYLTFPLHFKRSGLAKVVLSSFPAVFHFVKTQEPPFQLATVCCSWDAILRSVVSALYNDFILDYQASETPGLKTKHRCSGTLLKG